MLQRHVKQVGRGIYLSPVLRELLPEMVTFHLEGGKGTRHENFWRKGILGRGNSKFWRVDHTCVQVRATRLEWRGQGGEGEQMRSVREWGLLCAPGACGFP